MLILKILIHPGFHKTGTTTVQRSLEVNKPRLAESVRIFLPNDLRALGYSAKRYSSHPTRKKLGDIREKARELCEVLEEGDQQKPILMTCESLSGVLPGRENTWDYSAAPTILDAVTTELKLHFGSGTQILVVYSTRSPESWMNSVYWQNLRSARITEDFLEFREKLQAGAELDLIVEATRTKLNNKASVERFDISNPSNNSDLFHFLLRRLEIAHKKLKRVKNRNMQPQNGIETLLGLNRSTLSEDEVAVEKRKFLDSIRITNRQIRQGKTSEMP